MTDRLVDFLVVGTQKGGTTALTRFLRQHPSVFVAGDKEVHFFDNDGHFQPGPVDYAAYHAKFSPGPGARRIGEATPSYMYWQEAPRRIWEYNPGMKLIALLRNPIERAYSQWNMTRRRGEETLPFFEAIRFEAARSREALPEQHRFFSYVDRGFYVEQLRRMWRYFPREQTLILRSDDLRADPVAVLARVCAFLEIEAPGPLRARRTATAVYEEPMDPEARNWLRDVFEFEIRNLERILGWDCAAWLADPESCATVR